MTAQERHDYVVEQIGQMCATRDGITGHGGHLCRHADDALASVERIPSDRQTASAFEAAYEREIADCAVC